VEKELLQLGADVNARNKDGETPIFTTLDSDALALFIEHGADLTIRNHQGKTVMEWQKKKGPFEKKLCARQFKVRTSVSSRLRGIEDPSHGRHASSGCESGDTSHPLPPPMSWPVRLLSPRAILPTIGLFPFGSIHGYNSHDKGAAKCAV
jgi:hypothetical protein